MKELLTRLGRDGLMDEARLAEALRYLSRKIGLPDFWALLARIRTGDPQALADYAHFSVAISIAGTWSDWAGPEPPDTICRTLRALVERASTRCEPSPPPPPPPATPSLPPLPPPPKTLPPGVSTVAEALLAVPKAAPAPRARAAEEYKENGDHERQDRRVPSSGTPRWRDLARAVGLDPRALPGAAVELLDMVSRVIVAGKGWGPSDRLRGQHREIVLSPSRLSKHGQGHDRRTYQRQYKRLLELGLLLELRRLPNGACVVAPAWWEPYYTSDGFSVWARAAQRVQDEARCRTVAAVLSQSEPGLPQPCRTPLSDDESAVLAMGTRDCAVPHCGNRRDGIDGVLTE